MSKCEEIMPIGLGVMFLMGKGEYQVGFGTFLVGVQ